MQFKKFRSPGEPIRIASTSGYAAYIESELISLPSELWGQAYAAGAVSEDMQVDSMASFIAEKKKEQEEVALKEREEIKESLRSIFHNPVGYVDKDNKPLTRKVLGVLGKPIKKDVIDSLWEEIVKEEG